MSDTSRPIVCFFSVFLIARGENGPEDRTREIEVKLIFSLSAVIAKCSIREEINTERIVVFLAALRYQ